MTCSIGRVARLFSPAVLAVLLAASGFCGPALAEPVAPRSEDREIVKIVTFLVNRQHLSRHRLDDEMSRRCLKTFLKTLDPMKVFFFQSDVDAFKLREDNLDNEIRRGDVTFAYEVFDVFLRRVDQRVEMAEELITAEHDFTIDEEMVVDREARTYATDEADARDKWRKRIKYDLLVLKADEIEGEKAREKLKRRYSSLKKRWHQADGEELLEMYLTSMTSSFDPHTTYMAPSTLENFRIAMSLELDGIGAALQAEDGYTVVQKIIPGGAADKDSRLSVKDKIVGVGQGKDGEIEDVMDMKLGDVVKLIRGRRGTVVRLELISESSERKVIDITRARIELKDSEARSAIFEEGQKPDGTPYKIGVIDLPSFYMDMAGATRNVPDFKSTTRDVRRILRQFKEEGVDALILDLRRNGGGSLREAIDLTGLFIDQGPVVQVKDADGQIQGYPDPDQGTEWDGPMIVLTSKFSASASEILAGAIQDYGRGLIVGDPATHGKGTVQSLMDLSHRLFEIPNAPQLGALKITMQQFYRPCGDSTQNRGVLADVELPSLTAHFDVSEADLDYPVAFDHVEPMEYDKLGRVTKGIRDRLSALSTERRRNSEDFQKVLKNIARYKQQKERKRVTLNETKFMEERAELNADKEEKDKIEEMSDPSKSTIERNYYLDEAVAIMLDYIKMTDLAQAN